MIEEAFHDSLVFFVLDWDCHAISAEVTLDPQDVFVTVRCLGQWACQVQVYIVRHIPLFPWIVASCHSLVQLFVMFLDTSWTNLEDLSNP